MPCRLRVEVGAALDDGAPPLRDPDPVAVPPDARVHLEVALAVARRRRGRSRSTTGIDGSGAVRTSSPVSPDDRPAGLVERLDLGAERARLKLAGVDRQQRAAADERAWRRPCRR